MKVTKVEIVSIEESDRLRATCFVVLDYTLVIDNIKILENNGELFIAFPRSRSSEDKNYQDITIIKSTFRTYLENVIINEYRKKLEEDLHGKTNNVGKDAKAGQPDSSSGKNNSRIQRKPCEAEKGKKGGFPKTQRGTKRFNTENP